MSFNGSGTFVINTAGQPVVSGTVISSTAFNALTADLATGLSTCITKDGQTTPTANIPMGNNKITNLAVGTAATDAANLSQVQSTTAKLVNSISGADTITGTMSPNLAAYATGQMFYFIAAGDNTGAVTLNIDSLGAKAVTRDGSVALAAGDIKSGEVVVVVYDGTRFQVVSQINSSGNATFANVSITSALNVGGVATFSAGTAAAPSITTSGDTNNGIFFPATDVTAITTAGSERLRVDASGNLGLGVTPSAWSGATGLQVLNASLYAAGNIIGFAGNSYLGDAGANDKYIANGTAVKYLGNVSGDHRWYVAASGTAGNAISFTTAMVLDASGNLGVGTTSPGARLDLGVGSAGVGFKMQDSWADIITSGSVVGSRYYYGASTIYGRIYANATGFNLDTSTAAVPIVFGTNNAERARITSGGFFKASNYGTYNGGTSTHEFTSNANDLTLMGQNDNASFTNTVFWVGANRNTTNNTFNAILYRNTAAGETRFLVADSGNVTNTNGSYGTISDAKMKTDIVDAGSQWNDLKAVRFRKFKMKNDPAGLMQLGVVAQELEQVSPGLVDEHADRDAEGNDLGTTTKSVKTSVLLMKAAVALQEAMARIEKLEAEVAALKGA